MQTVSKKQISKSANGVLMLSEYSPSSTHEAIYLALRAKEDRILSDDLVKMLPDLPKNHTHFAEWQLRKETANRFGEFLKKKKKPLKILDLGCGNGWFSAKMAAIKNVEVVGLDLNLPELEQAQKLFGHKNLQFAYGNIFENLFENQSFDLVVINAAIQYFPSVSDLFQQLFEILKPQGEIHILDSPFYPQNQVVEAKKRTTTYYESMGYIEMANFYFHHTFEDLQPFSPIYVKPKFQLLNKILRNAQNPFVWAKVTKNESTNQIIRS